MNTLAALSLNATKPKEREAQEILKALYAEYPRAASDLAALYKYFMPAGPTARRVKSTWEWVAWAAAGENDPRRYLQFVYVTESHITASNGHRLHRAGNPDRIAPGYYLPNGDFVGGPELFHYPNVDRVIPDARTPNLYHPDIVEAQTANGRGLAYLFPAGFRFDKRYIDQAVNGAPAPFEIQLNGPTEAARIEDADRLAVVMPLRA